jgi:5-methylcytosine-specific restriction endonuclease McrA
MTFCPQPRPRPRILAKLDRLRQRKAEERTVKAAVKFRDHGRCRVCGKPGCDMHELVPRSLGGRPSLDNSVFVCRACHQLLTAHAIKVYGENANRKLRFERIE